jgi:hypothetical protein
LRVEGPAKPRSSGPSTLHPQPVQRLVIFVDEIDAVQSLPFSTDEFFAAIRRVPAERVDYNRRALDPAFEQLTFCLVGVATPSDLVQDTRTTPFNIGRRIELTDFTAAEAEPLARGLGTANHKDTKGIHPLRGYPDTKNDQEEQREISRPSMGRHASLLPRVPGYPRSGWMSFVPFVSLWFIPSRAALLERVLYWTGGHPYLTQRLCQAVAGAPTGSSPPQSVDHFCRQLFLAPGVRERDDNLIPGALWADGSGS